MKRIHIALIGLLLCTSLYAQELEKFKEGRKFGFRDAAGNVISVDQSLVPLATIKVIRRKSMLGAVGPSKDPLSCSFSIKRG